jgi:hypothetical protein
VSLLLANASPDAIRFLKPQRVFEASHADWALSTESFGVLLALAAFEPAFPVGVEEHRRVRSAAPGQQLPTPGLGVSDDRCSRCGQSAALTCPNPVHGSLVVEPIGGIRQFSDARPKVKRFRHPPVEVALSCHDIVLFVSVDAFDVDVHRPGEDQSQGPKRDRAFHKAVLPCGLVSVP